MSITPKHRIHIERCPNPNALSVTIADPNLLEWAQGINVRVSDSPGLAAVLPLVLGSNVVLVSNCYDVAEVAAEFQAAPETPNVVKIA